MLHRWVVTPLLELAYLALGLVLGVVTFTVVVIGLTLSIGLLPVFLLGVPVLVATVHVVHGIAVMERRRAPRSCSTSPCRSVRCAATPTATGWSGRCDEPAPPSSGRRR